MYKEILELKKINKFYPGVVALNQIDIAFAKGEVHTLLGENGAGKSTLIKVLTGAIEPDGGEVVYQGEHFEKLSPRLAKEKGIAAVYQDLYYAPDLSIAENIFLGRFPRNGPFVDKKRLYLEAQHSLDELNINIDAKTRMKDITFSYRQLVEIAKAVSQNVEVLILDESTAALTEAEIENLFRIIRKLAAQGVTIIFISHRIEEVFEISDRITVMRDGEAVATIEKKAVNRKELLSLMVGRDFTETFPVKKNKVGETVLEVRGLCGNRFRDISFQVREGEILGVAGLVGAGRTEIMQALFGADPFESGEIILNGRKLEGFSPADSIRYGIGLVPEDRKTQGIISSLNVRENTTFSILEKICKHGFIQKERDQTLAEEYISRLRIKTPSSEHSAITLSGGNQQKVVLGRWLLANSKVLILDEPTRGIDVGAKKEIYQIMCDIAEQGVAIIMVSSEMLELIGMSDRIIVISEGRLTGELQKEEFSQEKILEYAASN